MDVFCYTIYIGLQLFVQVTIATARETGNQIKGSQSWLPFLLCKRPKICINNQCVCQIDTSDRSGAVHVLVPSISGLRPAVMEAAMILAEPLPYLTPGHVIQFIWELCFVICDVCVLRLDYLWHYRTSNLATTSQTPANRRLPANKLVSYKCFPAKVSPRKLMKNMIKL